jgi:probable rRNA maturation factor
MLEINNLTKFRVDSKSFAQVAKKVLMGENREIENISLALVDKEEMQKLNKKFRGKDKPTDVLSFDLTDNRQPETSNLYLGEVVICPEIVKEKNEEMMRVFIHGILHLCGYDHPATAGSRSRRDEKLEELGKKMQEKENFYLK